MKGRLVFWHMSVKQLQCVDTGWCGVLLCCADGVKGSSNSCFLPSHEKDGFLCVDSPCFCPYRFYSPNGVSSLPLTFIPQAANTYYLFLFFSFLLIMSFSACKCIWLLLIDSSAQGDIILLELELLERLQTLACHRSVFPQPCGETLLSLFSGGLFFCGSSLNSFWLTCICRCAQIF